MGRCSTASSGDVLRETGRPYRFPGVPAKQRTRVEKEETEASENKKNENYKKVQFFSARKYLLLKKKR